MTLPELIYAPIDGGTIHRYEISGGKRKFLRFIGCYLGQCGCDGSSNGRCWVSDLVCLGGGPTNYKCNSDRDCNGHGLQSRINRGTGKRADCYEHIIETHWFKDDEKENICK